jgi:hypothetical protein
MYENSSLTKFIDFQLATRQKLLTSPDVLINQATKYRTYLAPLLMKGLADKDMIQGGTEIVDYVQLKTTSSFQWRNPTDQYNFTARNSLTQIKVPWRFATVDSVTFEHEIDLNQGGEEVVFKRIKKAKNSNMEQDFWEGVEDSLWGAPNFDTMEGTLPEGTKGQMLSLRCFVTENGAMPTAANSGATGNTPTWTSLMNVSTTTYPNWKNQFETYDNTSQTTRRSTLIESMDKMWLDVQFMSPSTSEEYFKNTALNKLHILTSKWGYTELVAIATSKSNVLTPRASGGHGGSNDLGWANGVITYHGIPIKYIGKLDEVDNSGGDKTGTTGTNYYKYRFFNFNHFKLIFHTKHFRRKRKLDGGATNPNAGVVLEDTWLNLWCANRREQGVVVAA